MTWTPSGPIPPGAYVLQELEDQNISQAQLAEMVDMSPSVISEMINGKRGITADAALAFEAALGLGADMLLQLQSQYELDRVRLRKGADQQTALRKMLMKYIPLKEFLDRKILDGSNGMESVVNQVKLLFQVSALEEIEAATYPAVFRKAAGEQTAIADRAYVVRIRSLAHQLDPLSTCWTGSEDQRKSLWSSLTPLLESEQGVASVREVLEQHGIRLIIEPKFTGSKIEGLCMIVGGQPVIALSLRLKRLDSFWFTLSHELAHLELGHIVGEDALDIAYADRNLSEAEDAANRLAAEALLPSAALDELPHSYVSQEQVLRTARKYRRHPAIVVGRLQYLGRLKHNQLKGLQPCIAQYLLPEAAVVA